MKNLLTILLSLFALSLLAQQRLLQSADLVIPVSSVESRVIKGANIDVVPEVNLYKQTGAIKLIINDQQGSSVGTLDVLKFDACGGQGYIANEKEFFDFQQVEYQAREELRTIGEDITCLLKRRTVAEAEADTIEIQSIDVQIAMLTSRETDIRANPLFLPENRVEPKWVYTQTFDKLINEYMNGYELSESGMQAVLDKVLYTADENTEMTVKIGRLGDIFKDSYNFEVEGGKPEGDCYILNEKESLTVSGDYTYTFGRQGKCKGRTNINGDTFTITGGEVLYYKGLTFDEKTKVYTPYSEDWSITVESEKSVTITKGEAGEYMVFAVIAR